MEIAGLSDEFARFQSLSIAEIYGQFRDTALVAGFNRELSYREIAVLPVEGPYAPVGAALFLAILAFPDNDAKQEAVVKALLARDTKLRCPPKHPGRGELRNDPNLSVLLDLPNKRIEQTLADTQRRIHKRFRAAWVMWQKFSSSPVPATEGPGAKRQGPLRAWMLLAARQNSPDYPAFSSCWQDDPISGAVFAADVVTDSFRRQVMEESRPVIHAAMAFYLWAEFVAGQEHGLEEARNENRFGLAELVTTSPKWLKGVVATAEILRLSFSDLFPQLDPQHAAQYGLKFAVPIDKTIAFWPYCGPINDQTNFSQIFHQYRNQSRNNHR